MHTPYTNDYPAAVAVAAECVAATLGAVLWARPLPRRASTVLFTAGVALTAVFAFQPELAAELGPRSLPRPWFWLQLGATCTTLALLWSRPRGLGLLAAWGQLALGVLGGWVTGSNHEMMFAYLTWYGALLGVHASRSDPARAPSTRTARLSYPVQDAVIFLASVALAAIITDRAFEYVTYNGDEVAYTFQANVYAHFRAYAPLPPCPQLFENYWVFRHDGHAFSQYTPGWPLFMAPFDRLNLIWLAGPTMGGIVAVGIARLSRRVARGLGGTYENSEHIVALAGPLGAACAMLGPSMLLNAASRFSHTMVCACFAWAVESAAVIAVPHVSRGRAIGFGLLLGASTALGLATRPADGGFLGVGVFLYFTQALVRRRLSWPAFLSLCAGFALFGGLTLVILRLQLGVWFKTGYSLAPSIRPEAQFILSFPKPSELKWGIPLATGSYMWWPAAPALGVLGLTRALGRRERGTVVMLGVSSLCLAGFYSFVDFGRGIDDALGPRYVLPTVVAQAAGTAGALAPLLAAAVEHVTNPFPLAWRHLRALGPALVTLASALFGVYRIGYLTYPVAYAEYHGSTAPLRSAREQKLKHAVVLVPAESAVQGWFNLVQNPPLEPNPDVLFLRRLSDADENCARKHFQGRTFYLAHADGHLTKLPAAPP